MARVVRADERQALDDAATVIAAGGLVAIPTETVYGLAADAAQGDAVAGIFAAKGRPRFNPLIAHVARLEMAEALALFDPLSKRLAERFWPGPLTLVLPLREGAAIHPLVAAGLNTVALRAPRGFGQKLIARLGRPIAAPSANSSGRISATTAEAVRDDLGARIDLIVDGGQTPVGLESTIVKVEDGRVRLLRPGGLQADDIEELIGEPLLRGEGPGIEAPGQLASHYAPQARVRLAISEVNDGEALLAFGSHRVKNAGRAVAMRNLSPRGDMREAAVNLFAFMHELDASGANCIAVEAIPETGLGEAINDRLRRAAAPREAPLED